MANAMHIYEMRIAGPVDHDRSVRSSPNKVLLIDAVSATSGSIID
jgi:hypothetical protein